MPPLSNQTSLQQPFSGLSLVIRGKRASCARPARVITDKGQISHPWLALPLFLVILAGSLRSLRFVPHPLSLCLRDLIWWLFTRARTLDYSASRHVTLPLCVVRGGVRVRTREQPPPTLLGRPFGVWLRPAAVLLTRTLIGWLGIHFGQWSELLKASRFQLVPYNPHIHLHVDINTCVIVVGKYEVFLIKF